MANVIWATGYRTAFDWIRLPVVGDDGWPIQRRGVVPAAPGLYFLGLPFMWSMSSGLIGGVGRDAEYIVGRIAARARSASARRKREVAEPDHGDLSRPRTIHMLVCPVYRPGRRYVRPDRPDARIRVESGRPTARVGGTGRTHTECRRGRYSGQTAAGARVQRRSRTTSTSATTPAMARTAPRMISMRRSLASRRCNLWSRGADLGCAPSRWSGCRLVLGRRRRLGEAHPRELSIEPRVGWLVDRLASGPGQLRFIRCCDGLRPGRGRWARGCRVVVHHMHRSRAADGSAAPSPRRRVSCGPASVAASTSSAVCGSTASSSTSENGIGASFAATRVSGASR